MFHTSFHNGSGESIAEGKLAYRKHAESISPVA